MHLAEDLIALTGQLIRFAGVGVGATLAHVTVFSMAIEVFDVDPLLANFIAYCIAFFVSFIWHSQWTFKVGTGSNGVLRKMLFKFVFVSLFGLLLNTLSVYLVIDIAKLAYPYAVVLMVTVVPLSVFALSKYWAFSHDANGTNANPSS